MHTKILGWLSKCEIDVIYHRQFKYWIGDWTDSDQHSLLYEMSRADDVNSFRSWDHSGPRAIEAVQQYRRGEYPS